MKEFLRVLEEKRILKKIRERVSTSLEISSVLFSCQDQPVLFENVSGSQYSVAGNLYGSEQLLSLGLGIDGSQNLVEFAESALANPERERGLLVPYEKSAWDYNGEADLSKLPILKHFDAEAGKYITAGVVAAKFPGTKDENLSVHRMLVLSKNKVAARIVPRHLEQIAKELKKKVPLSIIIGPPPAVFLSASLQTSFKLSEYRIANRMMKGKLELVTSELSDIAVPRDSEMLLEGYLDYSEQAEEGPFVDLTGTYDEVRSQAVITIEKIHTRKNSVYQAVVASTREHSIFMRLPQELKIRATLSKSIPRIRGVNLTPAARGYFHCVVSLEKSNDGDGKTAIMNCFAASHPLKLVIAVDNDVDPFDLSQVEWALATRFQADRGIVVINGARGSSLDPSSGKLAVTSKLGLDATLQAKGDRSKFLRATITSSSVANSIIASLKSSESKSQPRKGRSYSGSNDSM
ncbi:MAG: UbiD family decarboxylase [Nitrososphaerales archaeon]